VKLAHAVSIKHGFAFPGAGFGDDPASPQVLTPGNFALTGGFQHAKPKSFGGNYPPEYLLSGGEIVVTMTDLSKAGDTLGFAAKLPAGAWLHNQRVGLVIITDPGALDADYFHYLTRTASYRTHILSTASGSTVRHTSPNRIGEFDAPLPPLSEQRAIADVLGALDDKIAANTKLAATADEVVRMWFDEFAGRSADRVVLRDFATNVRVGVNPDEASGRYVGLEHVPRRQMWLDSSGSPEDVTSLKSRFERHDVLFGKLRPYFHKVVSAPFDGVCSTDILVIRADDPSLNGFLLACAASDGMVRAANAGSEGTRMPRAKWADLANVGVPWPSDEEVREFSLRVDALRDAVDAALAENRTLASLRDTLLPRLMDGSLRVRDLPVVDETA
jgi:type I restriction enzyme S subunit